MHPERLGSLQTALFIKKEGGKQRENHWDQPLPNPCKEPGHSALPALILGDTVTLPGLAQPIFPFNKSPH